MSANVVTRGALWRCISSRTNSCAAYIATLGANGARKVGWRAMIGKGHGIRELSKTKTDMVEKLAGLGAMNFTDDIFNRTLSITLEEYNLLGASDQIAKNNKLTLQVLNKCSIEMA